VKNIVAEPGRFNTELPLIHNHPYFQSVEITRDIDVTLVASLASVRLEDFRALNPSLHKPVILAAGMPQILLPWDNAQVFRKNLAAHNEGQYASWTVWTVPSTMSVTAAAQHAGMSEGDLRQLNGIPPRMMIKAGSALMVPRSANAHGDVASHVADNGQIAFTPEIVTRRTTVRAGRHDTVASIAQRYKVKAADVADWNDLKPSSRFKAGEKVVMYLPVRLTATAHTPGSAKTITKQSAGKAKAATHTAQASPTRKGGTPSRRKR
ncbi:MAG TPA: LysM peptidoglycan-binding domain-containing protein, partial [Alicycliphilus sp.]|nr:LysM peptidoglycan-binding domain-containing protein [Alicycliphilus sp.]